MSNAGIGRASALLASGTTVSRVLGFVKAIILVQTIGAVSLGGNAFAIANQLPNTIFVIVAGGMLNAVLVPQIVRASSHTDGGSAYINKLVTLALTVLAGAAIIATLLAPVLVRVVAGLAGDTPESVLDLAASFAYWTLPLIFFYGLYSVLGEVLNARRSFGPFTWAPVLNNVVAILGLIGFNLVFAPTAIERDTFSYWTPDKVIWLAGTATLGVAIQALVLFLFWKRIGLRYRPDFRWRGVGLGQAGKIAGWTFGMLLVTQLAGLVETNVVATAAGGDNASTNVLTNAWLVFMLPHSIVAVSIATAYFTRMSEFAHQGDLASVRANLSASLRVITAFMVLAMIGLIVCAYPFSRFFTDSFPVTVTMGNVLIGFLIGLPAFSMLFVIQRAFYSLGDTRTPFFITVFQAVIFSAAALVVLFFVPKDLVGVAVAVSLSVAGILQTILAAVLIRTRLGGVGGRTVAVSFLRFVGAAIPSTAAGVVLAIVFGLGDADGFGSSSVMGSIVSLVVIGSVMSAVYLGALFLVRSPELRVALAPIRARLNR
ncbi:murein biosynthesis integral membrane protein MurJ [Herbiconiux sp. CPCC 205763]|uniref:Murein biosynthesis integral membrane protein MurJ n=1 Tax=Herbiconiux aconitum TaxID=2970913 RepID=A0ABT2GMG9_9MICO|nr:murein biosynthesis integral membrane protein MurJ [Herbiconiux aconitum]MCS5717425.1 murein biosynthesis integral membrane protein MurJ [Herbiconiux aconitum]